MGPVHLLANDLDELVRLVQHHKFGPSDLSKPDVTIVYPPAKPTWFIQGMKDAGRQPVYTTIDGDGVCSDAMLRVFLSVLIEHGLPFATVTGSGDKVCRIVWSRTDDITDQGTFMIQHPGPGDKLHQLITDCARRPLPDTVRGQKLVLDSAGLTLVGVPYHGDLPTTVELTKDDAASIALIAEAMRARLDEAKPFITRFRGDQGALQYLWA